MDQLRSGLGPNHPPKKIYDGRPANVKTKSSIYSKRQSKHVPWNPSTSTRKSRSFIFNDFLLSGCKHTSLSYENGQVFTAPKIICPRRKKTTVRMTEEHEVYINPKFLPTVPNRKRTKHQFLMEMAAALKEELRDTVGETSVTFRPLALTFKQAQEKCFDTQIVVAPLKKSKSLEDISKLPPVQPYCLAFQYQRLDLEEPAVNWMGTDALPRSQLAVLHALVHGGKQLLLQAHFITQLPNISLMQKTLTVIKLDFNSLKKIPRAILHCENLRELYLRDNPIKVLSPFISVLKHLRVLEMNFCLLNRVPIELFMLSQLEILDLSYNFIRMLPPNIDGLQSLRVLNVSGNQLQGLPWRLLRLESQLRRVRCANNFMDKSMWGDFVLRSNCVRRVRRSKRTGAQPKRKKKRRKEMRRKIAEMLNSGKKARAAKCDNCRRAVEGAGHVVVRAWKLPCASMATCIPFIFLTCSQPCAMDVRKWPQAYWEL